MAHLFTTQRALVELMHFTMLYTADHILKLKMAYLIAENKALRQQLAMLQGQKRIRWRASQRAYLAKAAKPLIDAAGKQALASLSPLLRPDTLLKWYRQLVAMKYTAKPVNPANKIGRPAIDEEINNLIRRIAHENPGWGCRRIQGALQGLEINVSKSHIQRALSASGIEPPLQRRKKTTWAQFIKTHMHLIHACDFFTVEIMTIRGLVRYHVLFSMALATRKVTLGGIVPEPNGQWMAQIAKNWTDPFDGIFKHAKQDKKLGQKQYLIFDRAPVFTAQFQQILISAGVTPLKLPPSSPNLNAYAERWVRSIKQECLDHLILFNEPMLRRAVTSYIDHYNHERPHQGLANKRIEPKPIELTLTESKSRKIYCRERLGGLLKYYHRHEITRQSAA